MITDALRRYLWERKLLENGDLTDQVWAERERVKAAFLEACLRGQQYSGEYDDLECWRLSKARADLYPGPPTPIHLIAKLRTQGHRFCDCRRPGGPGSGR